MHRLFVAILAVLSFSGCKNENSFFFPVSEYSKRWIPANQDSIVFTASNGDTNYLVFDKYSTSNIPFGENVIVQQISQQGYSTDSGFIVNYLLSAGAPYPDSLGKPVKVDLLRIASLLTLKEIQISNTTITGSIDFLDSLTLNTGETYYDVFTDNTAYYFTLNDDVIRFYNGSQWFDKN